MNEQEQFEAWTLSAGTNLRLDFKYGAYWCAVTTAAWDAWQARAALDTQTDAEKEGDALQRFDSAVAAELPCVSTVPYNSHDICKWFAANLRKRLSASQEGAEG